MCALLFLLSFVFCIVWHGHFSVFLDNESADCDLSNDVSYIDIGNSWSYAYLNVSTSNTQKQRSSIWKTYNFSHFSHRVIGWEQ